MIVVAVDTATDRLSVAAGEVGVGGAGRIASATVEGARRHTGQLVSLVDETLGELGATLDQVDAVAMSDGPGSFTGLRVAAAWAKGFLRARPMPLWTASTLLVRAWPHLAAGQTAIGVGTALRGEVYLAGYRFEAPGLVTVFPPRVLGAGNRPPAAGPVDTVVSDQDAATVGRWVWPGRPRIVSAPEGLPDARALIGLIGVAGGATVVADPATWEPSYGRPAEAQVKWERAHGKPLLDSAGDRR